MKHNLLILGGTTEASELACAIAERGIPATLSYAGRVKQPKAQPIPHRIGGFGGVDGLVSFLGAQRITHVIDATHPFAEQMSRNAIAACQAADIPLLALTRPPWLPSDADRWQHVADIAEAVDALNGPAQRVLLAIGRMHLEAFADQPQHHYILRLVDPPPEPPSLPNHTITISRGPFDVAGDTALMRHHNVDVIISKNAGGSGAIAKLHAARALNLPVIMIARPCLPQRQEVHSVNAVFEWLGHGSTDLGV